MRCVKAVGMGILHEEKAESGVRGASGRRSGNAGKEAKKGQVWCVCRRLSGIYMKVKSRGWRGASPTSF